MHEESRCDIENLKIKVEAVCESCDINETKKLNKKLIFFFFSFFQYYNVIHCCSNSSSYSSSFVSFFSVFGMSLFNILSVVGN